MDYTRYCYRTVIRPYRDSNVEIPIRWYRPQPGATLIGGWSSFRSNVTWNRQGPIPSVGEQQKAPQTVYDKGADSLELPGDHHCGSDDVWQHGARTGIDPVYTTDEDGLSPCCEGVEVLQCCTHGEIEVPTDPLAGTLSANTFFNGFTSFTLTRDPSLEVSNVKRWWRGTHDVGDGTTVFMDCWIYVLTADDSCHMNVQVQWIKSVFPLVDIRFMRRIFDLDCSFSIGDIFPATGEITSAPWSPSFGATTASRTFPFFGSVTYEDVGWKVDT